MKTKKLLAVAISGILLASSCFSVSAVEKISTGTVYMNGYVMSGSLTVYDGYAQGYTYCEDITAKKSACTYYAYKDIRGVEHYTFDGVDTPYDNNKTDLSVTVRADDSIYYYYLGAMTHSKVQMSQSYYFWESEGTLNELRMGCYKQ